MRRAAIVLVSAILLASTYGGWTGLPDLLSAKTFAQRLVGASAVGIAVVAPLVLLAMWRGRGWIQRLAMLWAALFVARPALEILVHGVERDPATLTSTLATVTVLGIVTTTPVLLFAWLASRAHRRTVQAATPLTLGATSTPRDRVLEVLAKRGRVPNPAQHATPV